MSQLSVTFFTDGSVNSTDNLSNTANTELINYIKRKSIEAGYNDIKDLVKAFGTKNQDKIIRSLSEFGKTGELNQNYMNQLIQFLNLDTNEINAIKKRYNDKLREEENIFITNFDLLLRNNEIILGNENYRNITFDGLFVSCAWISRHRPLTIGELFYQYKRSNWIFSDCCGSVYLISAGGSPLSGTNKYQGYCTKCKKVVFGSRPSFSEIHKPYLTDQPDFLYVRTEYTIKGLVEAFNRKR